MDYSDQNETVIEENDSKKKAKVPKSLIIFTGALTAGGIGTFVLKKSYETKNDFENQNGRETSWYLENYLMDKDDFVVLHVGDHDSFGTPFQNQKMELLKKREVNYAIVVDSSAYTEEDIYDDVEYVKSLIRDCNIELPVYLNIDKIVTNDYLNNEMKTKIICDFLEKCSANGMYVGISGTDTNLCRVKNYCGITGYDAYLIQDSEAIQYDGAFHLYKDLKGKIHADVDLAEVIHSKNLNQSSRFCKDSVYVLKEGEDITDVAMRYQMSVAELLGFNNLKKRDLREGVEIRIPSSIETTGEYKKLEVPIRGCDMSYAQRKDSDFEKLAENFEFIILKSNEGMMKDDCFDYNAAMCNQYNISIGIYCYNAYHDQNCDDMDMFVKKQEEQADFTISCFENKKIEYPCYLDVEFRGDISEYLTPEQVQIMIEVWVRKITESGHIPGLYCNQSEFRYLQSCVDYDLADVCKIWIAGGEQYYSDNRDIDLDEVEPSYSILESDEFGAEMVQSTSSAIDAGAGNGDGHLDIDFCLTDYSQEEYVASTEDIKEFNRFLTRDFLEPIMGGLAIGVFFGGISLKVQKYLKKKR